MSVILLGATIAIAHFSLSFFCMDTDHTHTCFSGFQVQTGVYPLLTRLFGGPCCLGSSLGTWAFTSSNPLLPVPITLWQFPGSLCLRSTDCFSQSDT